MNLKSWPTQIAWRAWRASTVKAVAAFHAALSFPAETQAGVLQRILGVADGTAWAKYHGLSRSSSLADFRQRVPVQESDSLEPWILRIRGGECAVLTRSPVERLVPTSGTTGASKLIPMTRASRAEFSIAVDAWMGDLMRQVPGIMKGSCYLATSPCLDVADTGGAVPVGFAADHAYLGPLARAGLSAILAVPPSVASLRGENWREATRHHLFSTKDLRFLSLWHPGYLDALFDEKELASLSNQWSNLAVISTWADGACAGPAMELMKRFPLASHQSKGLWLTEGVVSIPWQGQHPIALLSGFLEFENEEGEVLLAHELVTSRSYRPVLTNSAGLYRYRTGDLVEVTGFLEKTPCLRWIGRADAVSDLCGEKLSEAQVTLALQEIGYPHFALMVPTSDRDGLRYRCLYSADHDLNIQRLESILVRNPHYRWARQLGQLGPIQPQPASASDIQRLQEMLRHQQGPHVKQLHLLLRPAAGIQEIPGSPV